MIPKCKVEATNDTHAHTAHVINPEMFVEEGKVCEGADLHAEKFSPLGGKLLEVVVRDKVSS